MCAVRSPLVPTLVLMLCALAPGATSRARVEPYELAAGLARLGPRPAGEGQRQEVVDYLLRAMATAGLEEVGALAASDGSRLRNLTGALPGRGSAEILLSAHYDTVEGSPGAVDDASGCAVILAAVADLERAPLRHTVRVLFFDGEEQQLAGSRSWVEGLERAQREQILANIHLDLVGWEGSRGSVLHTFAVEGERQRALTPAWLVHAVLSATGSGERPLAVTDPRFSLLGQLIMRASTTEFLADSDSLLAAGIPSVLLSDASFSSFYPAYHRHEDRAERLDRLRLSQWSRALTATVRRLDGLSGRPSGDDAYVVALGRVWHRRALYWAGFAVWALLVWRGIPGSWRGSGPRERRRQGSHYLPGFLFRLLLLVSLLSTPVFATVLLLPAGLTGILKPVTERMKRISVLVGWLPSATFVLALFAAQLGGWVKVGAALWLPAALVTATLASFTFWMLSGRATPPDASPEKP